MEGVIPNSKLVILPSARQGEAWKRELFLRPGRWIPWVTLTVILGTVVLAVVVLVLRLNEMVSFLFILYVASGGLTVVVPLQREDELERRRASHHINFDAL